MNKHDFEQARKLYPGTCRGFDDEWDNFVFQLKKPASRRKGRTIDNVIPLLKPAIVAQIAHRDELARKKEFVSPWKHFKTWINGGWWTEEIPQTNKPKPVRCFHCQSEEVVVSGFGKPPRCGRAECRAEYEKI